MGQEMEDGSMLLKDCPVGSEVRLVSFNGNKEWGSDVFWWEGSFKVEWDVHRKVNYVIDADGEKRDDIYDDERYQFEIVTIAPPTPNTITLSGKTYKLKPHTKPRLTVIDGVTYEMEEV